MCRQQTTVLWANTNYTCRIDLSVCCPCWFRIWQLNCQNNFLPSGSAGGKSMKIATKFNIVGSILVWYIHINTFLARAIIKLTVFHCRFATMSPEMREMEHGHGGWSTFHGKCPIYDLDTLDLRSLQLMYECSDIWTNATVYLRQKPTTFTWKGIN